MAAKKTTRKAKPQVEEKNVSAPEQAEAPEPTAEKSAEKTATAPATPKSKAKAERPKKASALDAAARVLEEASQAMTCGEMIEAMAAKGLWTSPEGKTPAATLYSSILRELKTKGQEARFRKTERGKFERAAR